MKEPHEIIGPYQVLSLVGRSSVASVYRAEHLGNGQQVALKAMDEPWEAFLPTIRREIHVLARIRHPAIVRILDSGIHEGLPWYAMELVEGPTLRDHVRRKPRLHETLTLVRRLCEPLAYLHGEGIVHRDLKPENVLVRSANGDLWPVLVDFGVAAELGSGLSRERLEVDASASGTVHYMAPEQIRGELLDARADLYALGCILYELLSSRPPFEGRSNYQVLQAHLHQAPQPVSRLVPELPPALDELLLRLLAKEPRARMGYAQDVAVALAGLGAEDGLTALGPRPRTYLYRPGFAGRGAALQELERLLRALDEGRGGLVLVGGESGIGKTRLVMEAAREAERRKMRVCTGECLPLSTKQTGEGQGGAPLQALRRLLQSIADRCRERGAEETQRLLGPRAPLLALYEPALLGLPGQFEAQDLAPLSAEAARLRLFTYLADTFSALASEEPLLLVLDDLQWADELTLGFLEYLLRSDARASGRAPLLVLGTYRTEEAGEGLRRLLEAAGARRLQLGRLEEESVGTMVGDMLALQSAPEVFVRFLTRHSEGNPFFVAEYLRTAVGEGILHRDSTGLWQVASAAEGRTTEALYEALPLPGSVRELVGRRLEGLSAEARGLVDVCSVLGREAEAPLLQGVARMAEADLAGAAMELLARQVLEELESGRLRFVHDKIREVAYERIPAERRTELHRAAAEALSQALELPEALSGGGPVASLAAARAAPLGPPEALLQERLGPARERTRTGGRPLAELGHHWDRAGEPARARPCYLAGARSAKDRFAHQEAERLYRAYLRLVEEPVLESIEARNELGYQVLRLQGHMLEALREHGLAVEEARGLGDRDAEAESLLKLGIGHRQLGNFVEAQPLHEQALQIFREAGNRLSEGITLVNLALLQAEQGSLDEARALFEQGLAIHREVGNRRSAGITLTNLALLHQEQGRLDEARALFEQGLAIHREVGNREHEGNALGNLAELHAAQGRLQEARAVAEQALAIHREVGNRSFEGVVLGNLAELEAAQGRLQESRALAEQAIAIHREVGDRRFEGITLIYRAALDRRMGESGKAGPLLDRAEQIFLDIGDPLQMATLLCERGHAALDLDRVARECLDKAEELAALIHAGSESKLGQSLSRLRRAVEAAAAGRPLFRGECVEELPEGLRRWLEANGQLAPRTGA